MDSMVVDMRHEGQGDHARTLLTLRDGQVLAISHGLVRFARDVAALTDPLGNGVRGVLPIPSSLAPDWDAAAGYVAGQSGGAVMLNGGAVVLIKPYSIELYATGPDALHGNACLARIDLDR